MFFFFKQKTAYEMRISDWSSDVCSSDLGGPWSARTVCGRRRGRRSPRRRGCRDRRFAGDRVQISARMRRREEWGARSAEHHPGRSIVRDRKSVVEGKSVSVRVDLGGRRIIQKKTNTNNMTNLGRK